MSQDRIRQNALEHFTYFRDRAHRLNQEIDKAERELILGMAIVDEALRMSPGESFDIGGFLEQQGYPETEVGIAFSVLPLISGSLGLLDWVPELADKTRLPWQAVRELLESDAESIDFEGRTLTKSTVFLTYYRRALEM